MSTPAHIPPDREATGGFDLAGIDWCRWWCREVDNWLVALHHDAVGDRPGVALVATGGHGRGLLAPHSDVDLMLLHQGGISNEVAERLWYPIWDAGFRLGHSVRTPREARDLARSDLDTATALLSARSIAGSSELAEDLRAEVTGRWRRDSQRWLTRLSTSVEERHRDAPEVAFALEPDLKHGRGGLRDVDALRWATLAGVDGATDTDVLDDAGAVLIEARVALHLGTRRPGDRLVLQEQDAVAAHLGDPDADALMARVAAAGRSIALAGDEFWFDHTPRNRGRRYAASSEDLSGPDAVLRVAAAAASRGERLDRATLSALDRSPRPDEPWSETTRDAFVTLLSTGRNAIPVIEALDAAFLWDQLLPEWEPIRSRPQRNPYHRFTVDRHLLETAAEASTRVDRVERPDLLLVGALLHDIGKGRSADHIQVGTTLVATIAARMGFGADDVDTLVAMCEHHLLLPDVATRRDLGDPTTIVGVATAVGTSRRLHLLHALCEADSIATGQTAWSSWKAGLVADLVARVEGVLAGGDATAVAGQEPLPGRWLELVESAASAQVPRMLCDGPNLTLACADRPGLFSRVAGTMAVCGLDVVEATVVSVGDTAVEHLRLQPTVGEDIEWGRVEAVLGRALDGRLAITARLAERAASYPEPQRVPGAFPPRVRVDPDAGSQATVVEVVGPDRIGLLYRLTQALTELDLDITRAKVATIGGDVVDTFYVQDRTGSKVVDPDHLREIVAALRLVLDT